MNEQRISPIAYLALGDSLTEGIGANNSSAHFVAQYFKHLRHSNQCYVRNFGISGMTSDELLSLVNNPAMIRLLPKVNHITITTGGCDFINLYENNELTLKKIIRTTRKLQDNVKKILTLVRKENPAAVLRVLGFYIPLPAYEIGVGKASFLIQSLNRAYEKICNQFGAKLVDPFDVFLNRKDYFSDEVHPNQTGYDELAKLFISSLCSQNRADASLTPLTQ
jgi:lysophospholipase L1-like esterase